MSALLLKCSVCPKRPSFSDVSHLLTHISSKGHLANLHKLQVRSHQELEAGNALNLYNQWFQEHGVAGLLSERLSQKEAKQEEKKVANRRRALAARVVRGHSSIGSGQELREEEDVELNIVRPIESPTRQNMRQKNKGHDDRLLSDVDSSSRGIEGVKEEFEGSSLACLRSPQLKGAVYPGMDLFDAASELQKRRRNQKKDVSIVRVIELRSTQVEPTETVSTLAGQVLKQRHMDDLENDSPVEGEETMIQSSPKSAKPLPRKRKASAGLRRRRSSRRTRTQPSSTSATSDPLLSSSVLKGRRRDFRPAANIDQARAFGRILRNVNDSKSKSKGFTIYEDISPCFGVDGSAEVRGLTYSDTGEAQIASVPYPSNPLARQRHHVPLQVIQNYNPFQSLRERDHTPSKPLCISNKENIMPSAMVNDGVKFEAQPYNPLFRDRAGDIMIGGGDLTSHNHFNPVLDYDDDLFTERTDTQMTQNPFLTAVERLNRDSPNFGRVNNSFFGGHGHLFEDYRQPLFAP